ncbi:beta-glucosidase [Labilibacter marinus]|uniref:beta-glucosidase n=1 Tax=Labilibacter marinus TaxID=1477105 RepID=UPI000834F390|nr:glycoside hydrolase family 3 C-terminal domain-containing protein [Labilibacter marinus]
MIKSIYRLSIIKVCILVLLGSYSCQNNATNSSTIDAGVNAKIDSLVSQLSLAEKVSMLHGNSKFSTAAVERLGIPNLKLSDGPHGVREEILPHAWDPAGWTNDSSTYFPTGTALSATWNPSLALATGEALGEQARARNKDILLGPGVNIQRTPLCGRNFEYMSEDPLLNAVMCVPYIKGIQSKDVAACVKHWAVNNQETNRTTVDTYLSERALQEIYFPAFKAAVQEGEVYTIMGAYNKFRGVYCCESKYLLRDVLRDDWGFEGIVISDWDATHSTVDAANNGLDLEMGTVVDNYDDYYFANPLIKAVENGDVKEEIIDEKVKSILRVMLKTNMFEANRNAGSYNTPEHYQAAYNVAAEAIVLLKNDKALLPLDKNQIKSIAVIGDNATRKHCEGGFSSSVKAKYEITPLEGLKKELNEDVKVEFAQGYEKTSQLNNFVLSANNTVNEKLIQEAVKKAATCDVAIIFGGLNHDYDSEGLDRPDMKLPYGQDVLIQEVLKANPNTIVVMHAGSPVDMSSFANQVPSIVWGWLNGSEGGRAMANVLFGKVNPSGKMPFTLPVKLDDSPAHHLNLFPGENNIAKYEEDILVGYRWFDTRNIKPLYAFGHGLSYTSFDFSDVSLSQKEVSSSEEISINVTVTNTGKTDGAEVVQLYSHLEDSKVLRSEKELRAFKKVFLKAGTTKTITLKIDAKDLSYFEESTNSWKLEAGNYQLMIGNSSDNILLSKEVSINQ